MKMEVQVLFDFFSYNTPVFISSHLQLWCFMPLFLCACVPLRRCVCQHFILYGLDHGVDACPDTPGKDQLAPGKDINADHSLPIHRLHSQSLEVSSQRPFSRFWMLKKRGLWSNAEFGRPGFRCFPVWDC